MDVYIETVCSVDKTSAMSQALELNSPHTKERKHTDEVERIYNKIKVDVRLLKGTLEFKCLRKRKGGTYSISIIVCQKFKELTSCL